VLDKTSGFNLNEIDNKAGMRNTKRRSSDETLKGLGFYDLK